jgi:GDPmannose 4,6-dehydratase
MSKRVALITGVTGQDGSYLAELLLSKGYEVHGLIRRASTFNRERIEHLHRYESNESDNLWLHYADMTDSTSLLKVVGEVNPHEIYHLAAQSHVGISFEVPEYTADSIALGTLRLLEAIHARGRPDIRVYNAATSELFGGLEVGVLNEESPFHPRSPYGAAKLYAYWIGVNYREAFDLWLTNGILFNHESPRRGENFVTRKISLSVAKIVAGRQERIHLGNLDAVRDWGFAPDYVAAMHLMLEADEPGDFVVATGEAHSVRDFVSAAFKVVGVDLEWSGEGTEELGRDTSNGRVLVEIDPEYFRPSEVHHLLGDPRKIRDHLGWSPTMHFKELVETMVKADLEREGIK